MLSEIVDDRDISGDDAFFLHDTLGFPIDLTREIAGERGRAVDVAGFEALMQEQRVPHACRRRRGRSPRPVHRWRCSASSSTPTGQPSSAGARSSVRTTTVLAVMVAGERVGQATAGVDVDVVVDRTPFYAESGGQVGDTGTITTAPGAIIDVTDTQYGLAGPDHESIAAGCGSAPSARVIKRSPRSTACAATASGATTRPRTCCTGRCREVLGTHVQQAGSFVGPDRLRFDFSHHEPLTAEQIAEVERLSNAQVITDAPVRHYETTKAEAERIGAIAFFGEKYGDIVRVLEAGPSTELCGGTHVHTFGIHRSDQSRQRRLDRLEPAPDRGDDG